MNNKNCKYCDNKRDTKAIIFAETEEKENIGGTYSAGFKHEIYVDVPTKEHIKRGMTWAYLTFSIAVGGNIRIFSESANINFCPMCGRRLTTKQGAKE